MPIPPGAKPPTKRSKSAQEKGLDWQGEFQQFVEGYRNAFPIEIVRLYDTHSAGSFLPAQGGDFILIRNGHGVLLDTKYSGKNQSLVTCLKSAWSDSQASRMRLWSRAGGTSIVLFLGSGGMVEVWDASKLFEAYYTPRMKPNPNDCMLVVNKRDFFEEFKENFIDFIW